MFDLDTIAIDPVLASEGKWVKYMRGEFLVARWNNRKAETLRNEKHMEFYSELSKTEEGKIPEGLEKQFSDIQARIMAETILLDWKGVGQKDKEIQYTADEGFKFLSDPSFVDLFQFIQNESISRDNFASANVAKIVEDVKPSADS
jgi:hypothetical protein